MSEIQTFVWAGRSWSVNRLMDDLIQGVIEPARSVSLDRSFIESYATSVLGVRRVGDRVTSNGVWVHVGVDRIAGLPDVALLAPVILLDVGEGSGIVTMEHGRPSSHVVADGNHRIAKAYLDGVQSIPALLFSEDQASRYLCECRLERAGRVRDAASMRVR